MTTQHTMTTFLPPIALDDKYTATQGRVYLSGIQALVRLLLVQAARDEAAGLKTAGFVSGYRGSPLGGLDEALWRAQKHLDARNVKFVPGVNEELAATAVWGTQQVALVGESRYDGVFGMWYGKAPGVDRCVDVFKHMAHAGVSRYGGVLLVAGDDHGAYSSTLPNQSDHVFEACMVPYLYPDSVEEYVSLGLHGNAMSRFCGLPVGFKALADTVESSASIDGAVDAVQTLIPDDFPMPSDGVHARLSSKTLGNQARDQEALVQDYRIYAAMAYARANRLNRVTIDGPGARFGIVASGKSYRDVLEALAALGIDEAAAGKIGLRVFKISMPWPLEPDSVRAFSEGLREILVVEEKRQIVEYQLKEHLYDWRDDVRPKVVGKFDDGGEWARPKGNWLLPAKADLSVLQIARVIAQRVLCFESDAIDSERLAALEARCRLAGEAVVAPSRPPWYCSGCPHNTSTKVPEGSLALAGIGCHVMATAVYPRHNVTTTQMGGEGAPWIGQAWFSQREHMFVNLGDGTYFHSGSLAIRASVAAGVPVTYKILYNDAVAMTGGQPVDGPISVEKVLKQVAAEGVQRVALVSEDPGRWKRLHVNEPGLNFSLHHRDEMDDVQRDLREYRGVSVLVYEQVCAAEKRRRRKKGEFPQPLRRAFINELVCEGCGDCGVQSNCTSLMPSRTPFGVKRQIDQSSCNVDLSCLKGFCPSFVTVEGVVPRRPQAVMHVPLKQEPLPDPSLPSLDRSWNILITGIGGTGVITIGALIGMAAHMEGRRVNVLDMTGMSQKNGAVTSHVRIAARDGAFQSQRIPASEVDLLLGCDILTAGAQDSVSRLCADRSFAVINTFEQPSGAFAQDSAWTLPSDQLRAALQEAVRGRAEFIDAPTAATRVLGDPISTNLFLLGYAFQMGRVPVSEQALLRAIELNAVSVESNKRAFRVGRQAAVAPAKEHLEIVRPVMLQFPPSLESFISERADFLKAYQDGDYAARFTEVVGKVRLAELHAWRSQTLTRVVADNLFRLMAYKDEYEVARLYAEPNFWERIEQAFEGKPKVTFYLAPPSLSRNGKPLKRAFGPWMRPVFKLLCGFRFLRGTALDPFGRTEERRTERHLIEMYVQDLVALLPRLGHLEAEAVAPFANWPEGIKGFGHVKAAAIAKALTRREQTFALLSMTEHVVSQKEPAMA